MSKVIISCRRQLAVETSYHLLVDRSTQRRAVANACKARRLFFVPCFFADVISSSIFFSKKSCFFTNIDSVSRSFCMASCGVGADFLPPLPPPNILPRNDIFAKRIQSNFDNGYHKISEFRIHTARLKKRTQQCPETLFRNGLQLYVLPKSTYNAAQSIKIDFGKIPTLNEYKEDN
uniref:Uncharacterized protein n=1 Tax=Romanomermis culicivorax TaxID=13658 RepID=A0A915K4G7_ROMCU